MDHILGAPTGMSSPSLSPSTQTVNNTFRGPPISTVCPSTICRGCTCDYQKKNKKKKYLRPCRRQHSHMPTKYAEIFENFFHDPQRNAIIILSSILLLVHSVVLHIESKDTTDNDNKFLLWSSILALLIGLFCLGQKGYSVIKKNREDGETSGLPDGKTSFPSLMLVVFVVYLGTLGLSYSLPGKEFIRYSSAVLIGITVVILSVYLFHYLKPFIEDLRSKKN